MVKNTVKTGQSWCSAVICRNRSDFEMQFRLIVVSIFLKMYVKDHGERFSRLLEKKNWLLSIKIILSCKAVNSLFFVGNFLLSNGKVSHYSGYCLQVSFHVNNSNYSNIWLGNWRATDQAYINNPGFIQLFGRSYPPSQAYLKGDIF